MGIEIGAIDATDTTEEVRVLSNTLAKMGAEGEQRTSTAYAALMVEFLLKQDDASQKWLQFLVTIQAALATALYFSLKMEPEFVKTLPWIAYAFPGVIGLFGAITPLFFVDIAAGQRKWFIWYSHQFAKLAGIESAVYGELKFTAEKPSDVDIGRQSRGYRYMAWTMTGCWSLIFVLTVFSKAGIAL